MPADVQTPISLFLGLVKAKQGILLESAEVDGRMGRYSIIAWNFALRLSANEGKLAVGVRDQRLESLKGLEGLPFLDGLRKAMDSIVIKPEAGFEDMPAIARSLVGYFGYGLAGMFEPKLAPVLPPERAEACVVLPGNLVLFDHLYHRLCFLSLFEGVKPRMDKDVVFKKQPRPDVGRFMNTPDEHEFKKAVIEAKELIRQGECIQTVISTRFQAPFQGDSFLLYRRLRQVNPSPYMFYMRFSGVTLAGSSPELLVRCSGGELTTCPIAGTRKRGATDAEDEALAKELLEDPKELAEHVMLVDLARNDLGRIARPGSVNVDKYMEVEKFSHVMHITSYVKAQLKDGLDAVDVLASTFPAGTLSGAPKVRAMEIISDLERRDRGPYAGAVGWLGLDEGRVDLDTGILIRSLWVRDGLVHCQAGAGIVYDSDPDMEWQEAQNKAKVIMEVIADPGGKDVFTD
jgi:anthranilate synthase component 1